MEFERIKTPGIAHNAYLIGTQGIGIVIGVLCTAPANVHS